MPQLAKEATIIAAMNINVKNGFSANNRFQNPRLKPKNDINIEVDT